MCHSKEHHNQENASAQTANNAQGHHDCASCSKRARKRRKRRKVFRFLAFAALLWGTAVVSHRYGDAIVHMVKFQKVSKEMQVTYRQKDALTSIFFDAYRGSTKERVELRKMRRNFYQLMDKQDLTKQELDAFLKKNLARIQEMVLAKTPLLMQARNVLTPEQRKILIVRIQQMHRDKRRWRRWRRWHGEARHAHAY